MRPYSAASPWKLDPTITFLNHGAFGACPVPILEVQQAWRERMEAEPVRFLARELDGHLATARAAIGAFLGADPDVLAFVPNSTTGVSTVLRSLRFEPGDELLTTDHDYNAVLNAMAEAARRDGARVVIAHIPLPIASDDEAVEAVLATVTERTRLVVLSQITSPTAIVMPIARLVTALSGRGIDTLVDAAHAPGMIPLDLTTVGPAYWTANGHKWLCGPKGSAVLYVRGDRQDRIHPLTISHGWNDPRTDRSRFRLEFDWTGTGDPSPFLSLPAAIDFGAHFFPGGWPELMARNHDLAIAGRDLVASGLGTAPPVPDAMLGAMAAVVVPGLTTDGEAVAFHEALFEDGFEVPVHGWPVPAARARVGDPPRLVCLRISAQAYNEIADYERLASAVARRLEAL